MTPRARRCLAALDAHRVAFAARLDALPDAVVHAQPAPDARSLAQLAEHFVRIDAGLRVRDRAAGPLVRATSGVRSAAVRSVLALPLRIPAPASALGILPSATPRWPDVRARWDALRAGWGPALADEPTPGRVRV